MALTAEQRIERAHVKIMGHEATMGYASIIMIGDSRVDDETPTAYTNGRDKVYGRAFVDSLTDQELNGLILHEAGHMMYQHGFLWKHLWKQDADRANQAADYVINIEIAELAAKYPSFVALPAGGLLDMQYRGMDTQEVFNRLPEGSGGGGFDEHKFGELSDQESEECAKEVEAAVREGAFRISKSGGKASRAFAELTAPKVNWREELIMFATETTKGSEDSSWRKLNRRWLSAGVLMPASEGVTVARISVVLDVSGSVNAELVSTFMSEVVGICRMVNPLLVDLICCDAVVQSHDVYDATAYGELANKRKLKGGGGTNMPAALQYIDKQGLNPNVVIVLTDGYTPYPTELSKPTLWAITSKGVTAPVGVTIHVK